MSLEQNTTETPTETPNSAPPTQTSASPEPGSNTSSTTEEERIDLGAAPKEEAPAEDEQPKEGESDKPAEPNALLGAPEGDYDLSGVELPEGMTIDTEALAAVAPAFKEMNLSNEAAARIAGTYATQVVPLVEQRFQAQLEQNVVAQRTEWEGQARDAIAGKTELKNSFGEPLAFETPDVKQVQKIAARALDQIAPEGFREWLSETGLGTHPMMIAFAYQAGSKLVEDRDFEPTEGSSQRELTREEKYYGQRS